MKDQYVGDINDFAKYQVLRLAMAHIPRVVVAWMLTPRDDRNDGGRVGYLHDPTNRATDPQLFDTLAGLVSEGRRSVAALEQSRILAGCDFHSAPVPRDQAQRRAYFETLISMACPDSLVFLDPDNGIEVPSVPMTARGAKRYVYWKELQSFRQAGSSVLVYQHFPRVKRAPYLGGLLARLGDEMGDCETFAAHTSHVAFLFALRERHREMRESMAEHCRESQLLSFFG